MIHSIYKVYNQKSGKFYIGYTSFSIEKRFDQHIKESRSSDRPIHRAIRKHGAENFSIESLYETKDQDFCWNIMEPYFIRTTDAIHKGYNLSKGGEGNHIPSNKKSVDSYDRNGKFLKSYESMGAASKDLKVASARISMACRNAKVGKGSQVNGKWFCYAGDKPRYKVGNPLPGVAAAKKRNTGRRRPGHSEFMKHYYKRHKTYQIPEGTYTLTEASKIYGRDLLMEWCNNPDEVVTKMMIIKSKKLLLEIHESWVGKTRRELGFRRTT